MADEVKFYSTWQVADLLGINRNTFTRCLWDGRVSPPRQGPGRAFLWTEADIVKAAEALGKPAPVLGQAPATTTANLSNL